MPSLKKHFRKLFGRYSYEGDVFGVRKVNTGFLNDPRFSKAYDLAEKLNAEHCPDGVPNIRWRAHVAIWAASQGLRLEGDFVDCGVCGGVLAITICEYFNFRNDGRPYWLFDTYHGLPVEQLPENERAAAIHQNRLYKLDVYELAKRNFAPYPTAKIVRGVLPGSLSEASGLKKIAYLSMDLNSPSAEHGTIMELWERIVPSALVVLDDYGFKGHVRQYEMWNEFAQSKGRSIVTLPTGQGLLIK